MSSVPPAPPVPPYGPPITLALAKTVVASAEAEAIAQGWKMVIAIVDSSGHLVMLHKMDDVHYAAIQVAQDKASTAVNFKRSTKGFEEAVAGGGAGLRLLSIAGLCPLEGGVPLLQSGCVIGAVGVSGVSSADDGRVAQLAAQMLG